MRSIGEARQAGTAVAAMATVSTSVVTAAKVERSVAPAQ